MVKRPGLVFQPRLETLETRDCPAVSVKTLGPLLLITGDRGDNSVAITDNGQGNVTVIGDGKTTNASRISLIVVSTGAGKDNVAYDLTAPAMGLHTLSIDLGTGDDTADVDLSAGIATGAYLLSLDGRDGADVLSVSAGAVAKDALAGIAVLGGRGDDKISYKSDGLLNGSLALALLGGDNNDSVSADVTISAGSTGAFAGVVDGGKGDDSLSFQINDGTETGGITGLAVLYALADGGTGTNTCTHSSNVKAINC